MVSFFKDFLCFKRNSRRISECSTDVDDKFDSLDEVQEALHSAGLESSSLILAIDYTKSNETCGARSFGGRCLHEISPSTSNPYQTVIRIIGHTLARFDDDKLIPAMGFGDIRTKDKGIFHFYPDRYCYTFKGVLDRYNEITPLVTLSGPTNFAPAINEAVSIVKSTGEYHILVIIADGQVIKEEETIKAIVDASNYPLSIIVVGVGDGPWEQQKKFDNKLPKRVFDNYQFVNFTRIMQEHPEDFETAFAIAALMEVPSQYKRIRSLKYLDIK